MVWLTLLCAARFCFYTGVFSFIGIAAMRGLFTSRFPDDHPGIADKHLRRVQWATLCLSTLGTLAVVPLNAGMLLDDGMTGICDPLMLQIVWNSTIGEQTLGRAAALILVLVFTLWMTRCKSGPWPPLLKAGIVVTVSVIGWTFCLSGHSTATSVIAQLCVTVHVVMAGWWIGSFYPLLRLCQTQRAEALRQTLHDYGNQAVIMVGLLLFSGGVLLTLLLLNVTSTVNSLYLLAMGGKLTLVCVMLCFAAYHKWQLVNRIESDGDCEAIKKSITAEALTGLLVLAVTATITSAIGIAH